MYFIFITEYDHPCKVQVEVHVNDSEEIITSFTLDLVLPVEYLFRKLSLCDKGTMCIIFKLKLLHYNPCMGVSVHSFCLGWQIYTSLFSGTLILISATYVRRCRILRNRALRPEH